MKVINTTGNAMDTRVLDDEGKDITAELRLKRIVIEAGELNRVTLFCEGVEVDVVGDLKQ
jgi:hypothetical protein